MAIDFNRIRDSLKRFDFEDLFIQDLGWSRPAARSEASFSVKDANRTQSLWYWAKRQDGKFYPRDHLFVRGQPGDLFLSKLGQIVFDLSDFDAEGNVSIVEVARRLRSALDVERVTKKFYGEFQEQHIAFLELIKGISDERDRRWYAVVFQRFSGLVNHLGDGVSMLRPYVRNALESWQFLALAPDAMGQPQLEDRATDRTRLRRDGSNIAEYLDDIRRRDLNAFNSIVESLQFVLPYAADLQPTMTSELGTSFYLKLKEKNFDLSPCS